VETAALGAGAARPGEAAVGLIVVVVRALAVAGVDVVGLVVVVVVVVGLAVVRAAAGLAAAPGVVVDSLRAAGEAVAVAEPGDAAGAFLGAVVAGLEDVVRLGVGEVDLATGVPAGALAGALETTGALGLVEAPAVLRRTAVEAPGGAFPGLAGDLAAFVESPGLAGVLPVSAATSAGVSSGKPCEAGVLSVASWVSAVSGLAASANSAWFPGLTGANSGALSTSAIGGSVDDGRKRNEVYVG